MTTRRKFLRNSALGVAAVAAASSHVPATAAPVKPPVNNEAFRPLRVSVMSYSFRGLFKAGMMDIFHFFETCKYRYGLQAADLWSAMFTDTDDKFIDKVHSALEDRQLIVPNIAVDEGHLLAAGDDDPAKLRAKQDRYMQVAKRLGVGFIRFDAGPYMLNGRKETDGWTNREFDYLVKRYRELAAFAYDNGFKVGAENHWGPEKYWPNMEKLIKAVDHPAFAMCLHLYNGWLGTPDENLISEKACLPWVAHTHIPWVCCENPDLPKRLSILRDANYSGYYSVEQPSANNEYNLAEVQLAKVKAVLTSWNRGGDGKLYDLSKRFSW